MDSAAIASAVKEIRAGEVLRLRSAAADRATYLQRPDLGRQLDDASRAALAAESQDWDVLLAIVDGLSALAVERHAAPLIAELLPRIEEWKMAPVCVVEQGRVAIGDEIGERMGAQIAVVLIGERPGLSAPDSLGAYVTWEPRPGRTDAERNCISNIRGRRIELRSRSRPDSSILAKARARRLNRRLADESRAATWRGRAVIWSLIWKWTQRIVLTLVAAFVALYVGDWAVYKLRKSPQGSVKVSQTLVVPLKGNKQEYDYLGTNDVFCSVSIFSQDGESPCWQLRRNQNQDTKL